MVSKYVSLEGNLNYYNSGNVLAKTQDAGVAQMSYDASHGDGYPLPSDSAWYQINLGNVYTAKLLYLSSDRPVTVNLNNGGGLLANVYTLIINADVEYVYIQNSCGTPANISLSAYGTAGVRTPAPAPTPYATITITTSQVISLINSIVLCDAISNPITVTLPSLGLSDNGKVYVVKKIDSSSNAVTVVSLSGELIDGNSSKVFSIQGTSYTFVWNGTSWDII